MSFQRKGWTSIWVSQLLVQHFNHCTMLAFFNFFKLSCRVILGHSLNLSSKSLTKTAGAIGKIHSRHSSLPTMLGMVLRLSLFVLSKTYITFWKNILLPMWSSNPCSWIISIQLSLTYNHLFIGCSEFQWPQKRCFMAHKAFLAIMKCCTVPTMVKWSYSGHLSTE